MNTNDLTRVGTGVLWVEKYKHNGVKKKIASKILSYINKYIISIS